MKRLSIIFIAFGIVVCLCVFALPHFFVFADSGEALLSVVTSYSNNSSANPPEDSYSSTTTYPVSQFVSVCAGSHNRINQIKIRSDGLTSEHIFIRVDFTPVALKSTGMSAVTIADNFPVSVNGYNTNHYTAVTLSDTNYTARCYAYLMGEYLGDFGDIFISGVKETWVNRGNKTLSFLIEITAPASNTGNGLTLTLNTPISLYHTLNRTDTLYLIPTNVSTYIDYSEALFAYLVDIRNDVAAGESDLSYIWQFLQDHESDIDALSAIQTIVNILTSDTNNYIYKMYTQLQAIQGYMTYITAHDYEVPYLTDNDEIVTREGTFWESIIGHLTLINSDFQKSYEYQTWVNSISTDDYGNNSLSTAIDSISDANSIGTLTGFLSIFNIAENDPELLTSQGTQGFLYWFSEDNYNDIQGVIINPLQSYNSEDDYSGWISPYSDKVARMIEDLEGGD